MKALSRVVLCAALCLFFFSLFSVSGAFARCLKLEGEGGGCSRTEDHGGHGGGNNHGGGGGHHRGGGGGGHGGGGSDRGGGNNNDYDPGNPCNNHTTGQVEPGMCYPPGPGGDDGGGGGDEGPPPEPVVTEHDFQRFKIPGSTVNMWPNGWAVANRNTAFWADAGVKTIDLTLLGQPVQVRATPIKYNWNFGDGKGRSRTSPGQKPRTLDSAKFTHMYTKHGKAKVSLATIYTGEYRVNNGAWKSISGVASVTTSRPEFKVYRYHKYLVGDDCLRNPEGPDCRPRR